MSCRRALIALLGSVVGAAVLWAAGPTLPAPPLTDPDQLESWWRSNGTAVAALALVRIIGLALSTYLGFLSLVGGLVAATRWHWADRLFATLASDGARRLIVGGSLAAALSIPAVVSATAPATFRLVDLGPVSEFSIRAIGPSVDIHEDHPLAGSGWTAVEQEASWSSPEPEATGAVEAVDLHGEWIESWVVTSGDHLWSIAAETVATRGDGRLESTIASYWLRLIEHNRDVVGDNPDLIHPGQVIVLPD